MFDFQQKSSEILPETAIASHITVFHKTPECHQKLAEACLSEGLVAPVSHIYQQGQLPDQL